MNIYREKISELRDIYTGIRPEIMERLDEFRKIREEGEREAVFRELCFCILSSGAGPRIAQKSLEATDDILLKGSDSQLVSRLEGVHKYPDRGNYIHSTREYLVKNYDLELIKVLESIEDHDERRDFIAKNRSIKGIGYLQASHFLRNIGFSGYAILDKNILGSLYELGVIDDTKPPASKKKYTEKEQKLKEFAQYIDIEFDHLDLLLWYMMRGRIPR